MNAPRISRFSSSNIARSRPRLRIGRATSEQRSMSAKYGSPAKRSSLVASVTTSGSLNRWAYRSTDTGTSWWLPAPPTGLSAARWCGQQPVLAVFAQQQQLYFGGAGHRGEHVDDPGVQPFDVRFGAQCLRGRQNRQQVDRSRAEHRALPAVDPRPGWHPIRRSRRHAAAVPDTPSPVGRPSPLLPRPDIPGGHGREVQTRCVASPAPGAKRAARSVIRALCQGR